MSKFKITATEKKLVLRKRQGMKADVTTARECCKDILGFLSEGDEASEFLETRGELEMELDEPDTKKALRQYYLADGLLDKATSSFKKLLKMLK